MAETIATNLTEAPRDRPFDPWRCPRTDTARALVEDVRKQLASYEIHCAPRKRRRRARDQETHNAMVLAVVCDLAHRALTVPNGSIAIPLSKQKLGRREYDSAPAMSVRLPRVLQYLASPEMAFLEMKKGNVSARRQTTIKAGPRLLSRLSGLTVRDFGRSRQDELIVLKRPRSPWEGKSGAMRYKDDDRVRTYRHEMQRINAWLEEADLSFAGVTKSGQCVDTSQRQLKRYFNNGSFEQGGRLFDGFWQPLSKQERREGLRIQGSPIVTLDYAQAVPRILYGIVRAKPPDGDAYAIPGLERVNRAVIKQVMNSLLFAHTPRRRYPKGTRPWFPKTLSFTDTLAAISRHHCALKGILNTPVGFKAMFIESSVLVKVLLLLIDHGIVALPLHDALMTAEADAPTAKLVMIEQFEMQTGIKALVTEENATD